MTQHSESSKVAKDFSEGKPCIRAIKTCDGSLFTWNDVTNPITGKTWMDRNLGARRVATSLTDSLAYGDIFQWGRGFDGHQCRYSDTTCRISSTDTPGHDDFILNPENYPFDWRVKQNDRLWQGVDGVNNPCPRGYRLPTETEWEEEVNTWTSKDSNGAFESILKLPMAGRRSFSHGLLLYEGYYGFYWSSTIIGKYARYLRFNSINAELFTNRRDYGYSVRCIKD